MLLPFATTRELTTLAPAMGEDVAELVLQLVSARIRAAVGWDVDQVVDATYTSLDPGRRTYTGGAPTTRNPARRIVLPYLNLTEVTEVTDDDTGLALPLTAWDATRSGIVYLHGVSPRKVTVTYTAGFSRAPVDEAPPIFKAVALGLAENRMTGGVQSYTMGWASETFAAPQVDPIEDPRLDPWRVVTL